MVGLVSAVCVVTFGISEAGMRGGGGRFRGQRRGRAGRGRGRMMALAPMMPMYCPDFGSALGAWERFYKGSLYATAAGKQESARRPLQMSREAWYQVLWRYYQEPPAEYGEDTDWQRELAAITGHLHLGEWLAYQGDMEGAHETLERVRRIWMEVRERNGVRHFGDELTRFHDVMEPVVLWGTGETHGGVTEENIAEFEAEVAGLGEAWRRVAGFGFYPRGARGPRVQLEYRVFMTRTAEAVEELRRAVAERRLEEIPEAARGVKQAFVPLYISFG